MHVIDNSTKYDAVTWRFNQLGWCMFYVELKGYYYSDVSGLSSIEILIIYEYAMRVVTEKEMLLILLCMWMNCL